MHLGNVHLVLQWVNSPRPNGTFSLIGLASRLIVVIALGRLTARAASETRRRALFAKMHERKIKKKKTFNCATFKVR